MGCRSPVAGRRAAPTGTAECDWPDLETTGRQKRMLLTEQAILVENLLTRSFTLARTCLTAVSATRLEETQKASAYRLAGLVSRAGFWIG